MNEIEWLKLHRLCLAKNLKELGVKRFSKLSVSDLKRSLEKEELEVFLRYKTDNTQILNNEIFIPGKRKDKVIILLHSGGYVTGSGRTCIQFHRYLNERFDIDIYAPSYPLYPEVLAPNQVKFLYDYLREQKFDGREVFLVGVSAGANLILSSWNAFDEQMKERIKGLYLITGHFQNNFNTKSYIEYQSGERGGLSRDMVIFLLSHALGGEEKLKDMNPYLFPYFSKFNDLPYVQVFGAAHDVLRDDSRMLADKFSNMDYREYENGFHAFSNAILDVVSIRDFFDVNLDDIVNRDYSRNKS